MNISKHKGSFILMMLLFYFSESHAQTRKLIGRIVDDESQKGIENAHVIIRGTSIGATTNALGYFELSVDPSKYWILVVSHIGYATSDIEVPKEDRFKFALKKTYASLGRIELADYPKAIDPKSKNNQKKSTSEKKKPVKKGDEVMTVVESGAEFPGGTAQFLDSLGNSIASAVRSLKQDISLKFTVSDSGKISKFILSDSLPAVETAVGNLFNRMPACTPATQRGRNVPQQFELTIGMMTTLNRFYKFMGEKLSYPLQARRMGIEGIVWTEFEISPDGKMVMPRVFRGIGAGCDEEVIKVLNSVPPDILAGMSGQVEPKKFIFSVGFGLERPFAGPKVLDVPGATALNRVEVVIFGSGPRR